MAEQWPRESVNVNLKTVIEREFAWVEGLIDAAQKAQTALQTCHESDAPHHGVYHNHGDLEIGEPCNACNAQRGIDKALASIPKGEPTGGKSD